MRTFLSPLAALISLAAGAFAASDVACSGPNARIEPPAGAIVVDATGSYNGSYRTVTEGVAHLNPNTTEVQTLFVRPGVYHEQVLVTLLAGPLVIQGATCDSMSYAANEVTITRAMAQKDIPAEITKNRNDLTSTLRLKTNSVKVYNINVANTAGNVGQAVATFVNGSDYGFYACNFSGYQDTLYANEGRELFAKTYISGAIDFVFGQYAKAWFESCDFDVIGKGCITANGRNNDTNPSWYVFNNARVFGSVNGTAYLGRPWRSYARVVWQNSEISNVINPKGWSPWNANSTTDDVYFKEFNNTGAGAATDERVSFSGQLNTSVVITDILGEGYGSEWWVDSKYL